MDYPVARRTDATDERAGVAFPDPYRWLEANTEEVRRWQDAQARLAANHVRCWPHFEALKGWVARFNIVRSAPPRQVAGRWFRTPIAEGATQARAVVAASANGEGRVLFDPQLESPGSPPFLSWISPSPDGRTLALGVCVGGSENNTIRPIDVATGDPRPGGSERRLAPIRHRYRRPGGRPCHRRPIHRGDRRGRSPRARRCDSARLPDSQRSGDLVEDGVAYPAVHIDAGDTDPRCPSWHARKFAARLQAAQAGEAPILLHIWENVGQGPATAKDVQVEQNTEWLAFAFQAFGLAPPDYGPRPQGARNGAIPN